MSATCETHGHIFGHAGVCVFCGVLGPAEVLEPDLVEAHGCRMTARLAISLLLLALVALGLMTCATFMEQRPMPERMVR